MGDNRVANWNKLGRTEKRIALAEDVIRMVEANGISPRTGTYLSTSVWEKAHGFDDVQELSDAVRAAKDPLCTVCAVGAIFVAKVGAADAVPRHILDRSLNGGIGDDEMRSYLDDAFTVAETYIIESAFEKTTMGYPDDIRPWRSVDEFNDAKQRAADMYLDDGPSPARLKRIMKDLVRARGDVKKMLQLAAKRNRQRKPITV
jgi:hypothetical protein